MRSGTLARTVVGRRFELDVVTSCNQLIRPVVTLGVVCGNGDLLPLSPPPWIAVVSLEPVRRYFDGAAQLLRAINDSVVADTTELFEWFQKEAQELGALVAGVGAKASGTLAGEIRAFRDALVRYKAELFREMGAHLPRVRVDATAEAGLLEVLRKVNASTCPFRRSAVGARKQYWTIQCVVLATYAMHGGLTTRPDHGMLQAGVGALTATDFVDVTCVAPNVSALWNGFLGHPSTRYAVVLSYVRPQFQAPISDADGASPSGGAGAGAGTADAASVFVDVGAGGDIEVGLAEEFQRANHGLVTSLSVVFCDVTPEDRAHPERGATEPLHRARWDLTRSSMVLTRGRQVLLRDFVPHGPPFNLGLQAGCEPSPSSLPLQWEVGPGWASPTFQVEVTRQAPAVDAARMVSGGPASNGTKCVVEDLESNTAYVIRVRALLTTVSGGGSFVGPWSEPTIHGPFQLSTLPACPTGVRVIGLNTSTIRVAWDPVPAGSLGIHGYEVQHGVVTDRGPSSAGASGSDPDWQRAVAVETSPLACEVASLPPCTLVAVRVRALRAGRGRVAGPWSAPLIVATDALPRGERHAELPGRAVGRERCAWGRARSLLCCGGTGPGRWCGCSCRGRCASHHRDSSSAGCDTEKSGAQHTVRCACAWRVPGAVCGRGAVANPDWDSRLGAQHGT
jgi:hypothetical protein